MCVIYLYFSISMHENERTKEFAIRNSPVHPCLLCFPSVRVLPPLPAEQHSRAHISPSGSSSPPGGFPSTVISTLTTPQEILIWLAREDLGWAFAIIWLAPHLTPLALWLTVKRDMAWSRWSWCLQMWRSGLAGVLHARGFSAWAHTRLFCSGKEE